MVTFVSQLFEYKQGCNKPPGVRGMDATRGPQASTKKKVITGEKGVHRSWSPKKICFGEIGLHPS